MDLKNGGSFEYRLRLGTGPLGLLFCNRGTSSITDKWDDNFQHPNGNIETMERGDLLHDVVS